MPETLWVLVVHYNTPQLTSWLIASLPVKTTGGRSIQVRVIDNDSLPDNIQQLRGDLEGLPNVDLVESPTNLGFGEGVNKLLDSPLIADSDFIWLLNPDTKVLGECVSRLEEELDRGRFAIVSPIIVSGDVARPWLWYAGGTLDARAVRVRHEHYGELPSVIPESAPAFTTEFVTGAAMMMRAGVLRAVGGFPPDYFLYWEDAWLSWQVRHRGEELGVVPSSRLWHEVGAASGAARGRTYHYWAMRNRARFVRDIGRRGATLVLGPGLPETVRGVVRAMREPQHRVQAVRAAARGLAHGLRNGGGG